MTRQAAGQLRVYLSILCGLLLIISLQVKAEKGAETTEKAVNAQKTPVIGRMGESAVVDVDEFDFSPAERKIWLNDHLHNVISPARLYYEFVKEGTFEEGFEDSVYLDIIEINKDGSKNAHMDFFTAERKQNANRDNLTNITGNPVIGIYMQGDVLEMNRLTDGHWRYFQKRIKQAFSESADISPVKIDFNGKVVEGEKITIKPYVRDPRRKDFRRFADKVYEFTFSSEIPGSLYQIKTVIPDNSGEDREALIVETLTLRNFEPRG